MPQRKRTGGLAKDRPLDPNHLPDWIDNPDNVSDDEANSLMPLVGTIRAMNARHGPNAGAEQRWGMEEVKEWIRETRHARIHATWYDNEKQMAMDEQHAKMVEDRVDEYLKTFTRPTPNDLIQLHEMARIELALGLVDQKWRRLSEKRIDDLSSSDLKTLSEVKKTLIGNLQAIEKSLGIDRERREEESDSLTVWKRVKAQAREILAKRRREIYCPNCERQGKKTYLGFIVFHYEASGTPFEFKSVCEVCNQPFSVQNRPMRLYRAIDGTAPAN